MTTTEEPSGSHLFGTESRIGHGKINIVGDGKEEQSKHSSNQDTQACLVAFLQSLSIILRRKHHIFERRYTHFIRCEREEIIISDIVINGFLLAVECHLRTEHEEHLAGTCITEGIGVARKLCTQHLRIAFHISDDLCLVRQYCMVEIFCNGTDSIYQRAVVNGIARLHIILSYNLYRLTHRILLSKQSTCQSFCDDTFIWGI